MTDPSENNPPPPNNDGHQQQSASGDQDPTRSPGSSSQHPAEPPNQPWQHDPAQQPPPGQPPTTDPLNQPGSQGPWNTPQFQGQPPPMPGNIPPPSQTPTPNPYTDGVPLGSSPGPERDNKGLLIGIIIGVIALLLIVGLVVFALTRDDSGTIQEGASPSAPIGTLEPTDTPTPSGTAPGTELGLPPALAEEGECLNDADDIADMFTVDCNDDEAVWRVAKRVDEPPEGSTDEDVVRESCAGTDTDDAIYALGDDALFPFVICLERL